MNELRLKQLKKGWMPIQETREAIKQLDFGWIEAIDIGPPCPECRGSGEVYGYTGDSVLEWIKCPECDGMGYAYE